MVYSSVFLGGVDVIYVSKELVASWLVSAKRFIEVSTTHFTRALLSRDGPYRFGCSAVVLRWSEFIFYFSSCAPPSDVSNELFHVVRTVIPCRFGCSALF